MTAPGVVRDKFLAALVETFDGAVQMISGLLKLLLLFPAIVFVMAVEFLVLAQSWLFNESPAMFLPVTFRKEA